jgi:hypothetical protein
MHRRGYDESDAIEAYDQLQAKVPGGDEVMMGAD